MATHVKPMFDACTFQLAAVRDGELTREEFAKIVANLSEQSVTGPFERLPLKYKTLFNAHACMDGRNCIGDFAAVAVSTDEDRRLTCATLASQISQSMPRKLTSPRNDTGAGYRGRKQMPVCTPMNKDETGGMTCVSK